jgi:hypothetical protein
MQRSEAELRFRYTIQTISMTGVLWRYENLIIKEKKNEVKTQK